jgi:hypothetical protein
MALTPNSLARRKPGVQIPSPPPHIVAAQSVVGATSAALTSLRAALGPRTPAKKSLARLVESLGYPLDLVRPAIAIQSKQKRFPGLGKMHLAAS